MDNKVEGEIYDITNKKLHSIYMDTVYLKNEYAGLGFLKLSEEYHIISKLGLTISHIDTGLKYTGNFLKYHEALVISTGMLSARIGDIQNQIEIKKQFCFNFYDVKSLREKRDRFVKILGLFNTLISVVERL